MGSLDSAYEKAGRAQEHLATLQASVDAYRASEPHEFLREVVDHMFKPELVVINFRVKVKNPPPQNWGLIVGDILTNLRAALDHALFGHAAARQTLTAAQERALQYPLITNSADWPAAQAKLALLTDPAVLQEIEKSQPFKAQNPDWHSLALLNGLVNRDKHRQVRVVSYSNEKFAVTGTTGDVERTDDAPREMEDGALVASVTLRRPTQQPGDSSDDVSVPLNVEFGYTENIELPKVAQRKSVTVVMPLLVNHVIRTLDALNAAGA
ncbi:hypothetical protein [Mycolicibacterium neoaurum]|uniref:hypothetical protein n=1 Tax=Mycolicibacterium neoaurum TaxID=1795 RepID=UPI001F4C9378|nr:hypothetical protein [Mycolicibacterium neoaurum]